MIRMTRRAILASGAACVPVLALSSPLLAQDGSARITVLLDGVGPGLDPALLDRVIAPFLAAGLPIACVADLVALTGPGAEGQPICDVLASIALRDRGLFEVILPIGKLERTERYFQLRRAADLRDAVVQAFGQGPAGGQPFPVVTLVDRGEDPNIDHTAFRGAGFRVHIRAGDAPFGQVIAGRGELVIEGGLWTRLDAPDLEEMLGDALAKGPDLLLSMTLANTPPEAADALTARAEAVAGRLAAALLAGQVRMLGPSQRRLFAGPGLPLDIALLVEPGQGFEEEEAVLSFLRDLAGQGVPFTLTGRADRFEALPGAVAFCAVPPSDAIEATPPAACLRDGLAAPEDLTRPVPVHIAAAAAVWPRQGIDADGRLLLTLRHLGDSPPDAALDLSPLEDHVIVIRPADVLRPVQRAVLLRNLAEAAQSRRAYFHTIPGLADHLVSTEPLLARLWSVRRRSLTDPWKPPYPTPDEQARLRDDARLAWRYIERFTDDDTGLCAGTVQKGSPNRINREATMWDLASQLHAIRVARQLELIDLAEARARCLAMIENLPLVAVEGHPLPPSMFRTDDKRVVISGFDVCDAGRFLIALRSAMNEGLVEPPTAQAVVDGWDLTAALHEGRPHSHVDGKWIDTTLSHCTPYIRRGMAAWGFDVVSPYAALDHGSATDRQIAQLYDVGRIGHVGVEPALLETIEMGPDPASDLIIDILFDAQLTWFETTGQLKCASEAPLNFPPWFSYQGLRVGYLGNAAWVVRGLGGAAEYDTPEFRARAELLSSKSAYLWAAQRQHGYCDRLLAVMREKAVIDGTGFSVGVFTGSLTAMPNYTDLNTNGVILTAIGHILRQVDGRP